MHRSFDEISRNYSRDTGISLLDVSPLYQRPEAHAGLTPEGFTDCLHYAMPGALDITASILLTMLYNNEI
jgi:hypothetical protein